MTIERGKPWGEQVVLPADAILATTNRELHDLVNEVDDPIALVTGGDMGRTVGAKPGRRPNPGDPVTRLPIDLGLVSIGERAIRFACHVVLHAPWHRGGWWRGPVAVVMNAQFIGPWDVAPRSHPNDGVLELLQVDGSFPIRQRWQVRQRLPLGTHLPHPEIRSRRITSEGHLIDLERGVLCMVDGVAQGTVSSLHVMTLPDAATICV